MASLLRWMGLTFARFVGLAVMILGAWIFILNLVDKGWSDLVLVWILASGLVGAVSGLGFLLSFDGPARFRNRWVRVISWAGMLASVALPTSLTFMLVPMVVLVLPTMFIPPKLVAEANGPITSE